MATHISASSATCTGIPVSRLRRSSRCLKSAPPPARIIPLSIMSDASSDGVHRNAYGLPNLLAGYDDGLGQPRDEVPTPYLGRLLLFESESAAELYLELFGCLGADGELVLFLYIGGDRIVDLVDGDADGGFGDDTAEGDDGDLASPAADIDDHRPLGLVDGEVRTYGSSQRLLDCVRL